MYPFFSPNLGVAAGAAIFWDRLDDDPNRCAYFKQLWHLPIPEEPLSDIRLANGIKYQCLKPPRRFLVQYEEQDHGELSVDLLFEAVTPPHYLAGSHLDQPGRFTGTIVLHGETILVDSFGFRDRSWGPRPQIGPDIGHSGAGHGGYSYATAGNATPSTRSPWTGARAARTSTATCSATASGLRSRPGRGRCWRSNRPVSRHPRRVRLDAVDGLGRSLVAEGEALNSIGVLLNPNLYTVNGLFRWTFSDGGDGASHVVAFGEDHDNWSMSAARTFLRS